jgi:hypothetical protein
MEHIMKNAARIFALSAISLALVSGTAFAQSDDVPLGFVAKTERDIYHANEKSATDSTVRQAVLAGNDGSTPMGFAAKSENEIYAGNEKGSGLTRADVRAEAIAAAKAGELPIGFVARSERDLFPGTQSKDAQPARDLAGGPRSNATR